MCFEEAYNVINLCLNIQYQSKFSVFRTIQNRSELQFLNETRCSVDIKSHQQWGWNRELVESNKVLFKNVSEKNQFCWMEQDIVGLQSLLGCWMMTFSGYKISRDDEGEGIVREGKTERSTCCKVLTERDLQRRVKSGETTTTTTKRCKQFKWIAWN